MRQSFMSSFSLLLKHDDANTNTSDNPMTSILISHVPLKGGCSMKTNFAVVRLWTTYLLRRLQTTEAGDTALFKNCNRSIYKAGDESENNNITY